MANLLASLLNPAAKPVGTGMAEQGRQALLSRAYQLAVQEAKANGEVPPTFAQWSARQ